MFYCSNQHVNLNVQFQRGNLQPSETFGFHPLAKSIKLSISIIIIIITTTIVLKTKISLNLIPQKKT